MDQNDNYGWERVIVRVALNALSHPVEYAKILITIGHEPLPTYKARTIFGNEKVYYPNIFKYMRYIRKKDGFFGCYRGLTAKLSANVVGGLAFQKITESITFSQCDEKDIKNEELSPEQRTRRLLKGNLRESAGRAGAIIVSHPLHVIAIRMMAEFVGDDGIYTGVVESIRVIYKEEGIGGFFSGVIPRLICDLGALWIANTAIHILHNYIMSEEADGKEYIRIAVRFVTSSFMYPYQVVGNNMAVTNSGLIAGSPPCMPHYDGWYDCYKHLGRINCLKRGSSMIWRAYSGPLVLINGPAIPNQSMFAPLPKFD